MATIFQEVFGSRLVKKNMVEEQNLKWLPSPNELKKKIILKGRKRTPDERNGVHQRTHRVHNLDDLFT